MTYAVVLDTCVLFGGHLRDTLLRMAEQGLFRPLWSEHILAELESNLVERGVQSAKAERIVTLMRTHFEDALVDGYEPLIESMENDAKDRHVLAAAVRANAAAIVTNNVKDFPPASTAPYRIAVVTADEFLIDQLDLEPGVVMRVLEQQSAAHKRPPYQVQGLLSYLERAGVRNFAAEARRHLPPLE
jgi:predicted nucleic acid-binding protein